MITSLRLQHFRSYDDAFFEFGPGVNIIVGPNGSGKTNLLEAVQVIALGRSYRAADEDLVAFEAEWGRLDAAANGEERIVKLDGAAGQLRKTLTVGGREYKRITALHTLPVVLFEPNNLLLLHGPPDLRRTYMDDLLTQLRPGFGAVRLQYRRTLAQRNALLKKGYQVAKGQLFAWDLRLSQLGGELFQARLGLIDALAPRLKAMYQELSGDEVEVAINYHTSLPHDQYATALLTRLDMSAESDSLRGFTTHGPHREDFRLNFDGTPADLIASRGETRTVLLALKLIELDMLEEVRERKPLLLLDDVFSELDIKRRRALTTFVDRYQTFITTTDADVVTRHFLDAANTIALGEA